MRPVIRELCLTAMTVVALAGPALAKNVKVDMTVKEVELDVDNKGTKQKMWTYGGSIPGPLVRVTQGDVVEFTLTNDAANKNSHSMDFHAAVVDVLERDGTEAKFRDILFPSAIALCSAAACIGCFLATRWASARWTERARMGLVQETPVRTDVDSHRHGRGTVERDRHLPRGECGRCWVRVSGEDGIAA